MILRRLPNLPRLEWRDPFEELERMRRQMDRLFEGLSGRLLSEPTAGVFPLVNVTESKDNYYVRAELPGVKSGDMDISQYLGNGRYPQRMKRPITTEENGKRENSAG